MLQQPEIDEFTAPVGEERRSFERTPVAIFGRCMFENKLEVPCQAINMSPGDIAVITATLPKVGEKMVIYLDNIGRLSGDVVRTFEGGFAMLIEGTPRKREKLASQIAWLRENVKFGNSDLRRHERIVPRQKISEIRMNDGRVYPIEIIDISLSGAAIKSEVRPALDTPISLGGMQGRVVRHFAEGIAIEFTAMQTAQQLDQRIR